MPEYQGLQSQIWKNNFRSLVLLILFPVVLLVCTLAGCFLLSLVFTEGSTYKPDQVVLIPGTTVTGLVNPDRTHEPFQVAFILFHQMFLWVLLGVILWFCIAYFIHSTIIRWATKAIPVTREEAPRLYNIVENLCITNGMKMVSLYVIDDHSMNAYASGIDESSYAITVSLGLEDKLDDAELEAVIAHELGHIKEGDTRLMIISIVFTGIFAFVTEAAWAILRIGLKGSNRNKDARAVILVGLIIFLVAWIGYFCTLICRMALSRSREFLADALSAQMTKNPQALASALEKIAKDPLIEAVSRKDVAQLFIENPHPKDVYGFELFKTHPPIAERIRLLRQF